MDAVPLITEGWREQNALLHEKRPSYGIGGKKHWKAIKNLMEKHKASSVLDYGCGKGTLRQKLGKRVVNYDPAIPKWAELPGPEDIVACLDVLEHVEPECLDTVLRHLKSLTRKAGYFVIACRLANEVLPDGRNTHCSVHTYEWWMKELLVWFDVEPLPSGNDELICVVTPRNGVYHK